MIFLVAYILLNLIHECRIPHGEPRQARVVLIRCQVHAPPGEDPAPPPHSPPQITTAIWGKHMLQDLETDHPQLQHRITKKKGKIKKNKNSRMHLEKEYGYISQASI